MNTIVTKIVISTQSESITSSLMDGETGSFVGEIETEVLFESPGLEKS